MTWDHFHGTNVALFLLIALNTVQSIAYTQDKERS